jgi:branched-chain amino acid aminotransferase
MGVLTHALNYGTAVFGGIRAYWNDEEKQLFIFRSNDHFRRFLQSARLLCMEFPYSAEQLTAGLVELLRAEGHREDVYIRPLAYYSDEQIGVRLHNLTPALAMAALPFGHYATNEDGMHVTVSSWRRIDDNSIPARGKIAGAYVNSAFAKTDAMRAGFDEVLVLTNEGHISEGSAANFFLLRNERFATPPVTENILEGITRRTIIQLIRDELQMEVDERPIDRTEIYLADEAFLCGTGMQISAIAKVDHRPVGTGKMGPCTARLRDLFFEIVRGRNGRYRNWCVGVYEKASASAAPPRDKVSA